MAKTKWTKWVKHTPGNVIPPGFHIKVEEMRRDGTKTIQEGVTNAKTSKAPHWHMKDQYGPATMIIRYKFRIIEDEAADDGRVVRKVKEPA